MEGVCLEALNFAGNLNLNKLIVLYDSNNISLDSGTDKTFNCDVKKMMEGMGFEVITVNDGNDINAIDSAIEKAEQSSKPSFIIIKTIIGFASEHQNSNKAHGLVLNAEQLEKLKKDLEINNLPFEYERDVQNHLQEVKNRFKLVEKEFDLRIKNYQKKYKSEYKELISFYNEEFFDAYNYLLSLEPVQGKATREVGGMVLNYLASKYPQIVGGTADLSSSTKAYIKDGSNVEKANFNAKNILYGVREFSMAAITNGLALYDFMPFASTFMVFSDYMKGAIRLSALMKLPVTYILTHDSVAVGEDGPTHEPIEHLAGFRSMPNLAVFRPCNYEETCFAYSYSLINKAPSLLALTRQNIPYVSSTESIKDVEKGGYIISKEIKKELHAIIIATGSEVPLAIDAQKSLLEKGYNVRVVSMPCVEVFESQTNKYKEKVIPKSFESIVTVEAGSTQPWYKYAGKRGCCIGIDTFGESAPQDYLFEKYGITTANIVKKTIEVIKNNKSKTYSLLS